MHGPIQNPHHADPDALWKGQECSALMGGAISTWHDLVRKGIAPQPVIRRHRFTRWRAEDVRQFVRMLAEQGASSESAELLMASARKASMAAADKRRAAAERSSDGPPRVKCTPTTKAGA